MNDQKDCTWLVKHFAIGLNLLGCNMEVKSEPGNGTQVIIEAPYKQLDIEYYDFDSSCGRSYDLCPSSPACTA